MTFKKMNVLGASLALVGMATFVPAAQAQDFDLNALLNGSANGEQGSIPAPGQIPQGSQDLLSQVNLPPETVAALSSQLQNGGSTDTAPPAGEETDPATPPVTVSGDRSNYAQCAIEWDSSAMMNSALPDPSNNGFISKTAPALNPESQGVTEMQHWRVGDTIYWRYVQANLTEVEDGTITITLPAVEGAAVTSAESKDWFYSGHQDKADLTAGNVAVDPQISGNTVTAAVPSAPANSFITIQVSQQMPQGYQDGPETIGNATFTATQSGDCAPEETPDSSLPGSLPGSLEGSLDGSLEGSSELDPNTVGPAVAGSVVLGGLLGAVAGNQGSSAPAPAAPGEDVPAEDAPAEGGEAPAPEAPAEGAEGDAPSPEAPAAPVEGEAPAQPAPAPAEQTPAPAANAQAPAGDRGTQLANTGINDKTPAMLALSIGLMLAGVSLMLFRRETI